MENYMNECFKLAKQSNGQELTNPKVGAVIVKDGRIIAKGYHHKYGDVHAEIDAINNAQESIRGSTIYCNLEPCYHHGKQPPCVDRIIEEGFSKVVISNTDPNPLVAGKSIQKLRDNNIEVITDILSDDGYELNKDFFKYIETKRPYTTMKIAMSLDGKVALKDGSSKWITSEESRKHGRLLRGLNMAMLVSSTTIKNDNPSLTVRDEESNDPDLFILDTNGEIDVSHNIYNTDRKIFIFTNNPKPNTNKTTYLKYTNRDLDEVLDKIGELGYKSLLIESGGTLNFSLLEKNLVDEVHIYIAPKILGGKDSISAVEGNGVQSINKALNLEIKSIENINKDILIKARCNNVHRNH